MRWGTRSAGILLGCLVAAAAQAQVELEPFLKKDALETLKISPTGEYYAMTVPLEDQTVLAVMRRSDRQVTAKVTAGSDSVISGVWWVSDERVVVSVAKKYGSRDQPYATGELYATNADGSARRQIFGRLMWSSASTRLRFVALLVGLAPAPFAERAGGEKALALEQLLLGRGSGRVGGGLFSFRELFTHAGGKLTDRGRCRSRYWEWLFRLRVVRSAKSGLSQPRYRITLRACAASSARPTGRSARKRAGLPMPCRSTACAPACEWPR